MAVLTLAIFTEAFPELNDPAGLNTLQNNAILSLLDEVEGVHITNTNYFGTSLMTLRLGTIINSTQMAQLLLSAHFFTGMRFDNRHGFEAVGQVTTRVTEDGETSSYSSVKFDGTQDKILSTTAYGWRLINLRVANSACLGGFVVV